MAEHDELGWDVSKGKAQGWTHARLEDLQVNPGPMPANISAEHWETVLDSIRTQSEFLADFAKQLSLINDHAWELDRRVEQLERRRRWWWF